MFPQDGDYTIAILLARDRNENVEGLTEPHEVEITLDGERLRVFTVTPNRNRLGSYYADEGVDKGLEVRVPVTAGPHRVAATFLAKHGALVETERQPYQAHFNMDRHPRTQPALRSVSIAGPFGAGGVSETPSRRRIFVCREETEACARRIVGTLARRAYRRPVSDGDLAPLLGFYREAAAGGGFDDGIEMALRAMLASTEFLFRIERDPAGAGVGAAYRLDDVALASRLSFFLWSSPPDDQLLALAERGELKRPAVLERQVRRMLGDRRAAALSTNFAGQWLHLRNLAAARPDARLYPDFDDNLRQAFRRETELLFETILKENRSVTELLSAKYTFLNERLAKHYGVPNVYGDHFRRVGLDAQPERAGLLGHGSILTVTSYADRTSPVLRGKWILENILGMPPPAPPQNVPPLGDAKSSGKTLSMRERMLAAPRQPDLRQLPSADGSGRPVDGEFRCDRPLADPRRRRHGHRRVGQPAGKRGVRRCRRAEADAHGAARGFRHDADRKAAHLRAGAWHRLQRRTGDPADRPRRVARRLSIHLGHPGR